MAKLSFSAQIGDWTKRVDGAAEAIFRDSVSDLVNELNDQITTMIYAQPTPDPKRPRTGFLRASLVAAKSAMPTLNRANPGGSFSVDAGQIEAVIQGTDIGETIYLGYTAEYGAYVHFGANGRQPRPWVTLASQRWPQIVNARANALKGRLGL